MNEPNSFESPEFLKDLEFIDEQISTADREQRQSESQPTSNTAELADVLAGPSPREGSSSNQELELACLATGATGAAIALVQGEEIVCHASVGPHTPDVGVRLNPRTGLSGACIQTRHLQQCNDTETDPRVDPEACRQLAVRSIVVLPLINGDDLFGIFEVLSSRPNAFGQRDLEILQLLAYHIVESRRQNWQATATVPPKKSEPLPLKSEEVVPEGKSRSSESHSEVPRRERLFRRDDIKTAVLNVLVIASALLLGTLVGWRLGWQKATIGFHASSPHYRANAASQNGRTGHTVLPGKELQTSSLRTDECGQSAATDPSTQPPSGGLTVCQGGQVIFRLPPSGPSPIRDLQTLQRPPGLKAGPTRR